MWAHPLDNTLEVQRQSLFPGDVLVREQPVGGLCIGPLAASIGDALGGRFG